MTSCHNGGHLNIDPERQRAYRLASGLHVDLWLHNMRHPGDPDALTVEEVINKIYRLASQILAGE